MKNISFLIIAFFFLSLRVNGQVVTTIKGNLRNSINNPIGSATIVLKDSLDNIEAYTISNDQGYFELKKSIEKLSKLEFSHLAFLKEIRIVPNSSNGKIIEMNLVMHDNSNMLDDILITTSKSRVRDTVGLDLKKLNLQDNDNLKEILNQIPNFKLSDDGTIIYKGKNIDKILINKKPSFVNQNSIALENIENRIIQNLSIINNYQDDFELDFDETEESVLNIDTKVAFKNIITGSIEANYGYKEAYDVKAKGFLFSNSMNAFLTGNVNNIGQTIIKLREVKNLFSEVQPFSKYQEHTLNTLFASNENLDKDQFISTNLTIRDQSDKLKTSALIYFIAPKRINNVSRQTIDKDGNPLLNTSEITSSNTSSVLSSLNLAYKLTPKSILNYTFNGNFIQNQDNSNLNNELFIGGEPNSDNMTISRNINNIFSVFNHVGFYSKLNKKLIINVKGNVFHETSKILNDYKIENTVTPLSNAQSFLFNKRSYKGATGLKYNGSTAFVSSFDISYEKTRENFQMRIDNDSLRRDLGDLRADMEFTGSNKSDRFNYSTTISLRILNSDVKDYTTDKKFFVPVFSSMSYENNLNRFYFKFDRKLNISELEYGLNTIQPFNRVYTGSLQNTQNFTEDNRLFASYNYNNLFDGELFAASLSYNRQKNSVRTGFLTIQNGISNYLLFIAENSDNYEASSSFSKTLFQLKYPISTKLELNYSEDHYPLILNGENIKGKSSSLSPSVHLETLTKNLFNFRASSEFSKNLDNIGNKEYKSDFLRNTLSILIKNEKWKGTLTFLNDYNWVNDTRFMRNNIDLSISRTLNKFVLSFEARHLGELLSIINNSQYNSQFIVKDGVQHLILNNKSLRYAIVGIKYNL